MSTSKKRADAFSKLNCFGYFIVEFVAVSLGYGGGIVAHHDQSLTHEGGYGGEGIASTSRQA